jgi:Cu(I)/Ag(I) efflux system membrane fusion protein
MDKSAPLFHDVVGGPMRPLTFTIASALVVAAGLAGACKKDTASTTTTATTVDTAPAEPPPVAPRIDGPVGTVLDAYDSLRLQLAHDDAAAATKSAQKIADAAKTASEAATGATKQPLVDVATAAAKLVSASDIAGERAAFSDVSKGMVALLVADPSLQTGRFLFHCPMAKGYQNWVQTTTKLENPFFGKAMIDCGEQLKKWAV